MTDAFIKGMGDASARNQARIRKEIMEVLGIRSKAQFSNRRNGKTVHTPAERDAIERIFQKYGVPNPWGNA